MSFVSAEQRQLILNLLSGKLDESDFLASFSGTREQASKEGLAWLQRSIEGHDSTGVEFGLLLGYTFGITSTYLETLNRLANANWHERHEDVVFALGKLKSPSSIEPLYQAGRARYEYLDYDDAHALASKAIYALQAIDTPEAIRRIGDLMTQGVPVVQEQARRRLVDVAKTSKSDAVRGLAQQLLQGSA